MGGKGSGGGRPGAGRKPKDASLGALHGSRRTRSRAKRNQSGNQTDNQKTEAGIEAAAAVPEVQIPPAPGSLTLDELAVWNELAPLAMKEGTLSVSTYMALRDLCEAIVLKRKLLRAVDDDGVTVIGLQGNKAAHPLLTQFRGLMQRVEAGMLRFRLSPMGRELPRADERQADPFDEFDDVTPTGETAH